MSCNESNIFSKGREGEGGTRCDSRLCPALSRLTPTAPGGTVLLPRRLLFLAESGGQPAYFTVVSCSWQSPVKAACAVPYIARPVSYCSGISIGSCKVADPNRLYRRSAVEVQSLSDGGWCRSPAFVAHRASTCAFTILEQSARQIKNRLWPRTLCRKRALL